MLTMAGMADNWWGLKFSSWTLEEFQALGKPAEAANNALEYYNYVLKCHKPFL